MDKTGQIFGNPISPGVQKKAAKAKARFLSRFGDDASRNLALSIEETALIGPLWNIKTLVVKPVDQAPSQEFSFPVGEKPIIIGTIRMGYGHFRISMAMASAAHSMGYTPYWLDLHGLKETTAGKIIAHLNSLYSLGSRLSQSIPLFNTLYWEPLNSEGFKSLSYNAMDQKVSELLAPVCATLPKKVPFIATHVWPAQAAIHASCSRVVNVIPDNWPMGLHLAEGAIHTVQTPFAWLGYKTLRGMAKGYEPKPMPEGSIIATGHYVDHELVQGLEADTAARLERRRVGAPLVVLCSIGGAGAQKDFLLDMARELKDELSSQKIRLWVNAGDHGGVFEAVKKGLQDLGLPMEQHGSMDTIKDLRAETPGHHGFYQGGIMEAVYTTNILMRHCDILVTKPSELAFYPIPKLLIKRIGGHEAHGALRSSNLGDGTYELTEASQAAAMLKLMITHRDILDNQNHAILAANRANTYNGAYEVINQAIQGVYYG